MSSACGAGDRAEAGAGRDAAPRPLYAARELARSAPEASLTAVATLDVDSRGRVYIGEGFLQAHITVLAEDGAVLRRLGRRGEGPGEFQAVAAVQVLPGDSLFAYDPALGRITVFAPDAAEVAYTVNLTAASSVPAPDVAYRLARQHALLALYRRSFTPRDDPHADTRVEVLLRLLTLSGTLLADSLALLPGEDVLVFRRPGFVSVKSDPPFGRKAIVRLGPEDRIFLGYTGSPSIRILDRRGTTAGEIVLPADSLPVTPQELDSAAATLAENFRAVFLRSPPKRWPLYRTLVVDDRSRIWIGLAARPGRPVEWRVYDLRGAWLGSVELPDHIELRLVRSGLAYGVAHDALGVPTIVVYQLEERPPTARASAATRTVS
ncbi:MAG TPA: hypothetical protein VF192_17745 [Longimicrobiales bacterium]